MDELAPNLPISPAEKLITFVKDRPRHDRRYAIDASNTVSEKSTPLLSPLTPL